MRLLSQKNKESNIISKNVIVACVVICVFCTQAVYGQLYLTGMVMDADSRQPVPHANVFIDKTNNGVACDSDGFFKINVLPGQLTFLISSIGYKSKKLILDIKENLHEPILVELEPVILYLQDEIIVYGESDNSDPFHKNMAQWLNSTDDVMEKAEGVSMLRRANFALEPSIHGMSNSQVGIVIDGMKIFSACVDLMDPVSAYVEVENLKKLEVSKGAFDLTNSQGSGGTINFITHKPDFDRNIFIEAEGGYESVSNLKRMRGILNFADSSYAIRSTFSVKRAGDYYAGNGILITNSGFSKENYKIDIVKKLDQSNQLRASFIGDDARDIGYPVLLMDATLTKSRIFNINHTWKNYGSILNSIKTTLYHNKIDHWMDDYKRDVSEREVMADMYMPMFGNTVTSGLLMVTNFAFQHQFLSFTLDLYRLRAFADMTMESIFPDVSPAYMQNLADVDLYNFAGVIDHNWQLMPDLIMKTNLRFDYAKRDITNEFGKKQLLAFWPHSRTSINHNVFSASMTFEYEVQKDRIMTLAFARGERMPTHVENYGFFLYNILDGYFYTGNPDLVPEESYQFEIGMKKISSHLSYSLKFYYNLMHNYISGIIQTPGFKKYANIDLAYLIGTSINTNLRITSALNFSIFAEYTYGQNKTFHEPLPLIPPLHGNLSLSYQSKYYWLAIGSAFASAQRRVAFRTTQEDITDAYIDIFVRSKIRVTDNLELKCGVENLFDLYYHQHLSINNLPNRGRNIYLGINYRWLTK